MTPEALLRELLARLSATQDTHLWVGQVERAGWPSPVQAALQRQGLLRRGNPVQMLECPGCESACSMPVHSLPGPAGEPGAFVVCDRRDDINRVPVPLVALQQWGLSREAVVRWATAALGLPQTRRRTAAGDGWELGIVQGQRRNQMALIRDQEGLRLVVGARTAPLEDLVRFVDEAYGLDVGLICQWADEATTGDARYTPSTVRREVRKLDTQAKYAAWHQEYMRLQQQYPNQSDVWYSAKIARESLGQGADSETIRKRMKLGK